VAVPASPRGDQIALIAGVVILVLLLIAGFLIVRPFLSSLLWGVILAIGTWPLFVRVRHLTGGRALLASTLLVIVYMAVLVVPLVMVGDGLIDHVSSLSSHVSGMLEKGPPPPPVWLGDLPLIGKKAVAFYKEIATGGAKAAQLARSAIGPVTSWLLNFASSIGFALAELVLALVCTGIFYANGEAATCSLRGVVTRIGGERAQRLITIAHGTIQSVVYGIVGSALAQAILAGIGFAIAGIGSAFPLAVATFFVALLPTGALPVWLPVTIWVFVQGDTEWGIFLLLWSMLLTGQVDNFIKPYFIARGSPLPLLLVFLGVLGGAVAFGFLGLFLGPTILSILYVLIREWSPPVAAATVPAPPSPQAASATAP
jgi:predicted PurR-regulated permease PerM